MGFLKKYVKALLSVSSFFFFATGAVLAADGGQFLLVSDVDDTIKLTNVLSYRDAVWNGLYGTDAFVGLEKLLQALMSKASKVVYISGSPQSLQSRIESLLQAHEYPTGDVVLSNWLKWQSVSVFKTQELKKQAKESTLPFLFIGDDTESDPEVYAQFRSEQGQTRVVQAYIHRVTGRAIPDGLAPYFTAFDVALKEVEALRISPEQAIQVGKEILKNDKPDLLFPYFTICPKDLSYSLGEVALRDTNLVELSKEVETRIHTICSAR